MIPLTHPISKDLFDEPDTQITEILLPNSLPTLTNKNSNFKKLTLKNKIPKNINSNQSTIFYQEPVTLNDAKFQIINSTNSPTPIGLSITAMELEFLLIFDNSEFVKNKKPSTDINVIISTDNCDSTILNLRNDLRPEYLFVIGEKNSKKSLEFSNLIYTGKTQKKIRLKKSLKGFVMVDNMKF